MSNLEELFQLSFCYTFFILCLGVALHFMRIVGAVRSVKSVAKNLNFSFSRYTGKDLFTELEPFPLFLKGKAKKIYNFATGKNNGLTVSIFNYVCNTVSTNPDKTKSVNLFEHTVLHFKSEAGEFANFSLYPHRFWGRVKQGNIRFKNNPVFDKKYLIQGSDKKLVRSLFDSEVIDFFEKEKNWHIMAKDNQMIMYKQALLKPRKILKAFNVAEKIVKKLDLSRTVNLA